MSHAYLIEGGRPLHGEVACSGAKNSALKLLAASLLAPGTHTLGRVPDLDDVTGMSEVLRHLGADVTRENGSLGITVPDKLGTEAPYEFVSRMRASTAVLGPLLAREGRARVALPGGCNLGPRRIDLHLKGLEQLGADIRGVHGFIEASCDRLRGAAINLDYPSHGATENLLMAGVLAEGRTVIENASREPEIVDLAQFLERMGADVRGAGHYAVVRGTEELLGAPVRAPDIRAGAALVVAGLAADGRTIVEDIIHIDRGHEDLEGKLAGLGADIRRVSAPVPSP